jgi:hypothetical protein
MSFEGGIAGHGLPEGVFLIETRRDSPLTPEWRRGAVCFLDAENGMRRATDDDAGPPSPDGTTDPISSTREDALLPYAIAGIQAVQMADPAVAFGQNFDFGHRHRLHLHGHELLRGARAKT